MRKRGLAAALCVSMAVSMLPAAVMAEEQSSVEAESTSEVQEESFDYSAGLDEKGFFEGIRALDHVKLPDISRIYLDKDDVVPSETMVEAQIKETLNAHAEVNKVEDEDCKLEDGSTVNIDYVGSVDGVEFAGGSTQGNGTTVTIGVTNYIDDFLEQLIGHAPGEEFDIEVTFPDPYPNNTDLSGKDAIFHVTINYVEETVVPEFDDAFVAENFPDYASAEEYRQAVEDAIYRDNMFSGIYVFMEAKSEVESIPESVMETIYNERYENLSSQAAVYGLDEETFLAYMGMDLDAFRSSCEEFASSCLIMQAIMEELELEIDDETAKKTLEFEDDMYDLVVEFYGKPYVLFATIPQYAMEKLSDNVILEEAEESESEEQTEEVSSQAE